MIEIKLNAKKNLFEWRESLKSVLKTKINQPIINKNDSRLAMLPFKNIGKLGCDKAIQKSINNGFSLQEHFSVAENIILLYENAILKEVQYDVKNGFKDTQIPRYIINIKLGNKKALVLITLKETISGKYKGNKLYSVELKSLSYDSP